MRDLTRLARIGQTLKPYAGRAAAALLALSVAAGSMLAFGAGLAWMIDAGFRGGDVAMLDRALFAMLGVIVVLAGATFARAYFVAWIGERIGADLRRAVYGHVLDLSPAFFEVTRAGDVVSRLTGDISILQSAVGSSASMALRNVLMILGGATMMAVTSPRLTALVFLVVPLVVLPILVFGRRVRRLARSTQDRVAAMGAHVDESISAIRTVQAFGHEDRDRAGFAGTVEAAFAAAIRQARARGMLAAGVILTVFGAIGVVLWIGGHDMLEGRITAGQLGAFVYYAVIVAGSVGGIGEFAGDLQRAVGASERLFELLDERPDIAAPSVPTPLPEPPAGTVAFENVTFHYPSRPDRPALADFTLSVASGEKVALVGPSGAGKTTAFQLLLRFYDPGAGSIRLDGVDLRAADPAAIRRRLALVAQEPVVFSADAMANIRYGRPEANDAEIRAAAIAAGADEFIDRLPQGYATFLGERGTRLSGGQRQRLAIARAILRDPAVLLLDEATSALDAESERLVQAALDRLMAGRTSLVIAHRLATVQKADRIVVLDQGRILAIGRHEELVRQGGLYARLAALQFDSAKLAAAT